MNSRVLGRDLTIFEAAFRETLKRPLRFLLGTCAGGFGKAMADDDKRRAPRKRVLKGARIVFNERSSTLSCTVRDISDTGARVRVAQGQAVPAQFDLLIDADGFEASCSVAWRRGEEVGVVFDAPPTVNAGKRAQVVTAIDRAPLSIRRKPIK